jgi:CubicO group peptidase (beta-lactamase class C family)
VETLHKTTAAGDVHGTFDPKFSAVADAFVNNFEQNNEVGASVALMVDGTPVVDLWGGRKSTRDESPWNEDTISVVFSSTKGLVALAAHTLISAGELDINAPVKRYWPEFAANGKEEATVKMMLDHSVGVPCFREQLRDEGCCDWEYMIDQLEQEAPFWKPGTRNGYHMMNFGWTVGELIRRVSGQSLGTYFKSAIADPTGADAWIGLPEQEEHRVASMIPFRPEKDAPIGAFTQALLSDPQSIQALALFNNGGFNPNSQNCHAAEIGGGGGIANGRGLANVYAPFACGGVLNATLLIPTRFSLGFMKSIDNRWEQAVTKDSAILGSAAFGHVGAGGSIGFADPTHRMSFGYTMNRMGPGILMNERGQALVDAAYQSLGCRSNRSGVWR